MTRAGLEVDRRGFLRLLGCGGCAVALGSLPGCTIAEVFDLGGGELAFDVAEQRFAALGAVNGVATADIAGRPVLLIRTAEDTIVALNRLCTHTQCDMSPSISGRWDGEKLICTCHDSHFAADGKLLKGPATRDLTAYPVQFDAATGQGVVTVGDAPDIIEDPVPEEFRDLTNPFDPEDQEALAAGETLWQQCAGCHGANGEGVPGFAEPVPTMFSGGTDGYKDGYLFWRVRTGPEGGPAGSIMPAYDASQLTDEQVWQVITWLRSLGQ